MHFDFHNYTSWTFLAVFIAEGQLKNDPRKFGLFTSEVTVNYLNLLLIKTFLKLLSHGICDGSIGSENYGTTLYHLVSLLWFNFHYQRLLLSDKGPRKILL